MEFGTRNGGFVIIGLVAAVMLAEAAWIVWRRKQAFPWGEALGSFGVAVIKRGTDILTAGLAGLALMWVWERRLWTAPLDDVWDWLLFLLAFEFVYYWHHRWAHEVRWLWGTHSVHHSPSHLNLSVALRLGWTGLISGSFIVFAPLVWLGYHPLALVFLLAANLFYQIWIHTELIPKLGPLEWVLNTPSHHRVHHAVNPRYLDRNYGGVLIIFDRLFGTFAKETRDDKPAYGLVDPLTSRNPFVIALREWWRMIKDAAGAKRLSHGFLYLFGPPGWSPDGSRKTTRMVRAEAGLADPPIGKEETFAMSRRRFAYLAAAVALMSVPVFTPQIASSQATHAERPAATTPAARAAARKRYADRLRLTADQKTKVAPILLAHRSKMRKILTPYIGKREQLSMRQKIAIYRQVTALRRETRGKMAGVLDARQMKEWDAIQAELQAARRARMRQRRTN